MIIFYKHYNQLCNRLWAFLPALALALEFNQNLLVFGAYKEYLDLFPNLKLNKQIKFLFNKRKFNNSKLLGRFWSLLDKVKSNTPYDQISANNKILFLGAFEKRYEKSYILKHKESIKDLFQPSDEVKDLVEKKFIENSNSLFVGIHIRRGDYKEWNEGKYYFGLDYYYKLINLLYHFFKNQYSSKEIKFIISSNENFDIHDSELIKYLDSKIKQEDILRFNKDLITDLYALSQCDYLIGPPSTFSQWASFIGKAKLYFIDNETLTTPPHIENFRYVKFLDSLDESTSQENPLVTIIVITYNSSKYVSETLESLLKQDYDHRKIEIIISDDCSNDTTEKICKDWINKNNNKFYNCVFTTTPENKGIAANYNNALKYATGEWIKYIAGDDRLKPECISTFVDEISSQSDIIVCYWENFSNNNPHLGIESHPCLENKKQLKAIVKSDNFRVFHGPTLFVKKDYLLKNGGFDERFMFAEDYPFGMQYLLNGGYIKQIKKPLIEYRCYPESVSAVANPLFTQSLYGAIKEYLPKAAIKSGLPFHWYHYKLLSLEMNGITKRLSGKVLLYILRSVDYISYKKKFRK